jgi:predicted transcriptional regulator
MDMMPVKPERKAQLEDYAQRHGQDAVTALDDVLGKYLDWERREYQEAVEGIREGYEDMLAGRTRPAEESFEALRVKHGLPR